MTIILSGDEAKDMLDAYTFVESLVASEQFYGLYQIYKVGLNETGGFVVEIRSIENGD